MTKYNIAVVGATGNVGREILNTVAERQFPVKQIYALASEDSKAKEISFGDQVIKVGALNEFNFEGIDIVLSSPGSAVSSKFAPIAASKGAVVIDNTSFFRMDPDVPLIVPEVNPGALQDFKKKNIIANPNCCAIPLVVALKPLSNAVKIKRIVTSTYQSVSGAGKKGMDELYEQTKAKFMFSDTEPRAFDRQIAFNLIPAIDKFEEDDNTAEERKIIQETQKIMGYDVAVSATCVRVPVFVGHSQSVNIEFEDNISLEEIEELLSEAEGVRFINSDSDYKYATPVEMAGEDEVAVSRLRIDKSNPNSFNMWIVADNLRKGAALNAVQIAELLVEKKYI